MYKNKKDRHHEPHVRTYPLWPTIQKEGPIVKWEFHLAVVMTETPVHLTRWAHIQYSLHTIRARVFRCRGVIFAETRSWIADLVSEGYSKGILIVEEGS